MPKITLLSEVTGELAEKLANCFPKGVIELDETKEGYCSYVWNYNDQFIATEPPVMIYYL